jgi:hypothetical protein
MEVLLPRCGNFDLQRRLRGLTMEVFMKKAVLLFMFVVVSVLCCYAQEREQIGENGNALPFFSFPGLSTQTFGFGFSAANPLLNTNLLAWRQMDLGLTRYADYGTKSFFDTSIFKWGLIIGGGIAMAAAGILGAADANSDYVVNIIIFTLGLTATAGGILWLGLDD